jgi:hypothetical protein
MVACWLDEDREDELFVATKGEAVIDWAFCWNGIRMLLLLLWELWWCVGCVNFTEATNFLSKGWISFRNQLNFVENSPKCTNSASLPSLLQRWQLGKKIFTFFAYWYFHLFFLLLDMAENENQTDTSKNLHRFDHKNFIVPSTVA